uniref:Ig-like domain-containing protein n=1 Tax=Biomphalaria glabrata TaxID=6526 RepID=A0A2C9K2G2_BIOGL
MAFLFLLYNLVFLYCAKGCEISFLPPTENLVLSLGQTVSVLCDAQCYGQSKVVSMRWSYTKSKESQNDIKFTSGVNVTFNCDVMLTDLSHHTKSLEVFFKDLNSTNLNLNEIKYPAKERQPRASLISPGTLCSYRVPYETCMLELFQPSGESADDIFMCQRSFDFELDQKVPSRAEYTPKGNVNQDGTSKKEKLDDTEYSADGISEEDDTEYNADGTTQTYKEDDVIYSADGIVSRDNISEYTDQERINRDTKDDTVYSADGKVKTDKEDYTVYSADGKVKTVKEDDTVYSADGKVKTVKEDDTVYSDDGKVKTDKEDDTVYSADGMTQVANKDLEESSGEIVNEVENSGQSSEAVTDRIFSGDVTTSLLNDNDESHSDFTLDNVISIDETSDVEVIVNKSLLFEESMGSGLSGHGDGDTVYSADGMAYVNKEVEFINDSNAVANKDLEQSSGETVDEVETSGHGFEVVTDGIYSGEVTSSLSNDNDDSHSNLTLGNVISIDETSDVEDIVSKSSLSEESMGSGLSGQGSGDEAGIFTSISSSGDNSDLLTRPSDNQGFEIDDVSLQFPENYQHVNIEEKHSSNKGSNYTGNISNILLRHANNINKENETNINRHTHDNLPSINKLPGINSNVESIPPRHRRSQFGETNILMYRRRRNSHSDDSVSSNTVSNYGTLVTSNKNLLNSTSTIETTSEETKESKLSLASALPPSTPLASTPSASTPPASTPSASTPSASTPPASTSTESKTNTSSEDIAITSLKTLTTKAPEDTTSKTLIDETVSASEQKNSDCETEGCTDCNEHSYFGKYGVIAFALSLSLVFLLVYTLLMVIFMPRILAKRKAGSKFESQSSVYKKKSSDVGSPTYMSDIVACEFDNGIEGKNLDSPLPRDHEKGDEHQETNTGPAISSFMIRLSAAATNESIGDPQVTVSNEAPKPPKGYVAIPIAPELDMSEPKDTVEV